MSGQDAPAGPFIVTAHEPAWEVLRRRDGDLRWAQLIEELEWGRDALLFRGPERLVLAWDIDDLENAHG